MILPTTQPAIRIIDQFIPLEKSKKTIPLKIIAVILHAEKSLNLFKVYFFIYIKSLFLQKRGFTKNTKINAH
jgi:hypothetical protein